MVVTQIYNSLQTVGAFIIHKEKFAFMIGPNKEKDRLGIVRFGGHVETGESIDRCLHREMFEEISVEVKIVSSPVTYYKKLWEDVSMQKLNELLPLNKQPLAVIGDSTRSTALFLAYADDELKPSSETHGIIFLSKDEVKKICTERFTLREFLREHGELVQQKEIDYDLEILTGPHIKLLDYLIVNNESLIDNFIQRNI